MASSNPTTSSTCPSICAALALLVSLLVSLGAGGTAQAQEAPGEQTLKLLSARDYSALEDHLIRVHEAGRLGGHWRTKLEVELQAVAAVRDPRTLIGYANEWTKRSSRSSWPFLIRAVLALEVAKQLRRSEGRESDKAETWVGYVQRDLNHAQGLRPALSAIQTCQIEAITLAGEPRSNARQALDRALQIDRDDLGPALAYMTYLLPSWRGNEDEALQFARSYASGEADSPRQYVLLLAYAELLEQGYLDVSEVSDQITSLGRALDWKFPRAAETHLALARIADCREDWPAYARALKDAAKLGHRESTRRVADHSEAGTKGFVRDPGAARDWREQLARGGDTEAMIALAWQLARGRGVKTDLAGARAWFERAARGGDPQAHAALGYAYGFGELGVSPDPQRARQHLETAHEAGIPEASFHLGQLHNRGAFGQRAPALATRLIQEAAAANHVEAMLYLAECYASVSPRNALYYYRLAYAHGDARAAEPLRRILRAHRAWRTSEDPSEVVDPTRRPAGVQAPLPEQSSGDG